VILYCDTSALVKLYVQESDSEKVSGLRDDAQAVAVSRIAWAEAHSAFARRAREVSADAPIMELAKTALRDDWSAFMIVEVTQDLVELAGEYADIFALRAYDSVQLAAAFEVARISRTPTLFGSFDIRLNKAAKALGLAIIQ
jgi:uncharacterized protein